MFPDTDLPLALIMEEIFGWEKKEDNDKENEDAASQQHLSTRNKKSAGDCYIFHRLSNIVVKSPHNERVYFLCSFYFYVNVLYCVLNGLF